MTQTREPIAIIGMSCRLPGGANSVAQYWSYLLKGRDLLSDVPADRWSIDEHYHPDERMPGKTRSRRGGFIDNWDRFDPSFFGISAREAEQLDPQQRHGLELSWEALEDAGAVPEDLRGSRTGVYMGGFTLDYMIQQFADAKGMDTHTAVGTMMTMLSNRISYAYDFHGPAMTIDTACSSSVVALHEACEALRSDTCDMALAGAVELIYEPAYYIAESKGSLLSPDGLSRSFDADANGYVRGEGGGILVLKRLADAERDGDPIRAVILDSLVNQDGKTFGITLPNGEAQRALLEACYARAGIAPQEVGYVEAHGTGTRAGDPIEGNVIARFFGSERADDKRCYMASVKANIGHLEAASGIASVIKVICTLQTRTVAPHIGMKHLNPAIELDGLAIRIPTAVEPWEDGGRRRLAAVNSFGFGGTNAHVILAEYEGAPKPVAAGEEGEEGHARPPYLRLSARSEASLGALAARYAACLEDSDSAVSEIQAAIDHRRETMTYGLAVSGATRAELIEALRDFADAENDKEETARAAHDAEILRATGRLRPDRRLVFVYTGMGPQWFAMGRELYEHEPVYRDMIERVDRSFSRFLDWSIAEELHCDEASSRIQRTEVAQPMIFANQVALTALWRAYGVTADAIVGHSVGEVAAFYSAGVYTLDEAVRISYERSRCQSLLAGSGAMLAVGLGEAEALKRIAGHADAVSIAAINSPRALTLSGEREALEQIAGELEAEGIFNRFLRVDIPYHSLQMRAIEDEFMRSIDHIETQAAHTPLVTAVDGAWHDGDALDEHYWWRNIAQTVRFAAALETLLAAGYSNFIEIGPHPVLASSIRDMAEEADCDAMIRASLRRQEPERPHMRRVWLELLASGCVEPLSPPAAGRERIELPLYAWDHQRYWREPYEHARRRLGQRVHPLLGYDHDGPMRHWSAELNAFAVPYMADHRVQGIGVLSAAQFIETALQALASTRRADDRSAYVLDDLRFQRAVFLDACDATALEIAYDPADGRLEIHERSANDSGAGQRANPPREPNFAARARRLQAPAPVLRRPLADALEAATQVTAEACYGYFASLGLEYGPAFQGIAEAWCAADQTLARLVRPREAGIRLLDPILHPTVLDAAFQTLLLTQREAETAGGELKLPVSIERLTVYGDGSAIAYARALLREVTPQQVVGDLELLDEDGCIIAAVHGFTARTLDNQAEKLLSEGELAAWNYEVRWEAQLAQDDEQPLSPLPARSAWLILCATEDSPFGAEALRQLRATGQSARLVALEEASDPGAWPEGLARAADALVAELGAEPVGILSLLPLDLAAHAQPDVDGIRAMRDRIFHPHRELLRALLETGSAARLWLVSQLAVAVTAEDDVDVATAGLAGFARVLAQSETPQHFAALIDLDAPLEQMEALVGELLSPSRENEIAWRGAERYVARLRHIPPLSGAIPLSFDPEKAWLITGGFGSLGQITARFLLAHGAKRLVLAGRRLPDPTNAADAERLAYVRALEAAGAEVHPLALDVVDGQAVAAALAGLREAGLTLGGIFHAAGVLRDELLLAMSRDDFDRVYDAKAVAAWNLHEATRDDALECFVLYSSAGAVVTSVGQLNYAAGNACLDALAHHRQRHGLSAQSLAWGPWDVGMIAERDLAQHYREVRGMEPISELRGAQVLERVLGQAAAHLVICGVDWPRALQSYPNKPPLFNHLALSEGKDADAGDERDLLTDLAMLEDEAERPALVTSALVDLLVEITYNRREAIDTALPLNLYSVDSIIATEYRNKANDRLGIVLALTDILGGLSLDQLAARAYAQLEPRIAQRQEELLEWLQQIEAMSDEEATAAVAILATAGQAQESAR